jgi:hypothetical protein
LRKHWRDVAYWRWQWHRRVPFGAKVAAGVVLTVLLLGGGWFAADRLTAAHASPNTDSFVLEKTVRTIVTVHKRGKVIRKVVPIVTRVRLPGKTTYQTQTRFRTQVVTTPGTVQVVRRLVTKYVPVVRKRVVTVNGKTRTLVETRLVPTTQTQTETQTRVVTSNQTVTSTQPGGVQTITQTKTTTVPVTITQTQTQTQTQTETQTETKTVTQTETETVTVTDTVTVTETETETETK